MKTVEQQNEDLKKAWDWAAATIELFLSTGAFNDLAEKGFKTVLNKHKEIINNK